MAMHAVKLCNMHSVYPALNYQPDHAARMATGALARHAACVQMHVRLLVAIGILHGALAAHAVCMEVPLVVIASSSKRVKALACK